MDSMHRESASQWFEAIWPALFVLTAASGCQSPRSCNDITPGAIPQPNGTYACQWMHAERARADENNFVVYQYEWSYDGTKLTPNGQDHLACIARRIAQSPFPVVIECSLENHVNAVRRAVVLESLAGYGVQIDPNRVILGRSEAEGLYGQEAPGIAARMLTTQGSGQGAGGGTAGAGATLGGTQGGIGTSPGVGVGVGVGMGMGSY
jgi:hypothetical protein